LAQAQTPVAWGWLVVAMATAAVPPAGGFARADEVKRLQNQVDLMKERLEFMSPMMPLVNFVQDYFQKVECEASVQLMRLKNAQVMQTKDENSEEDLNNAQLETVKWLHFMTDAIMSMHNGQGLPTPASPPTQPVSSPGAGFTGAYARGGDGLRQSDLEGRNSPGLASAFPSLGGMMEDSAGAARFRPTAGVAAPERRSPVGGLTNPVRSYGSDMYGDEAPPTRFPNGTPPLMSRLGTQQGNVGRENPNPVGSMRERVSSGTDGGTRSMQTGINTPNREGSLVSAMAPGPTHSPPGTSTLGSLGLAAAAAAKAVGMASGVTAVGGPFGYGAAGTDEPLAEPGTGGTEGNSLEGIPMSGSAGLIMGRGSWATAYRQASGNRREALRLLCTSGIVTARELSDDLTVISEEHIEECVQIAAEMLQTWTLEMWARQPQEAKKFFEARLTALYQRKFGEQISQQGPKG